MVYDFKSYIGNIPNETTPDPAASGWICPRCGGGNAPWASRCPCTPAVIPFVCGTGTNLAPFIARLASQTTSIRHCNCNGNGLEVDMFGKCLGCGLPK